MLYTQSIVQKYLEKEGTNTEENGNNIQAYVA